MNPEITELPRTRRHFHIQLSPTPRGARLARLLAVEQLRTWELPLDLDTAALVIAELATNAATHGRLPGRDFRLTVYVAERTLRIEVADARGDRTPEPQHAALTAETGRGLTLVAALANRWGVTGTPAEAPRKTVWAELDLVAPAPGNPYAGDGGDNPKGTTEGERTQAKPHPSARRDTDG